MARSTYHQFGLIAPLGDGRWRAAHGIGGHCREVGRFHCERKARAAAGRGGREVIVAELGERSWDALDRHSTG